MPVAGAGQDRAADVAILPEVDPGLRNLVRCRLVEDVRLGGVVQGDVGDPVALHVIDGQIALLRKQTAGSIWPDHIAVEGPTQTNLAISGRLLVIAGGS